MRGILDLLVADLANDGDLLAQARQAAQHILTIDPNFDQPEHFPIRKQLEKIDRNKNNWAHIS